MLVNTLHQVCEIHNAVSKVILCFLNMEVSALVYFVVYITVPVSNDVRY